MAQALSLADGWASDLTLAAPQAASDDVAGLRRLPAEWQTVDRVAMNDVAIDHVVVGPNGIFTIAVDPDQMPADLHDDGIYRNGVRVTTLVKDALHAAHDLRRRIGARMFAYPILVTTIEGPAGRLDRLGVVPGGLIPEAIWSHAGFPMTRSQRIETTRALRSLTE